MKKRGALELSISTIVIIVIAMTMLILGIVFVRNIMCSGIVISDKISNGVENEIIGLFGAKDYGVKCMGEGGAEVKLGDGGRRQIVCIINSDSQVKYKLEVISIESLKGTPTENVQSWIKDQNWEGSAQSGTKTVTVAVLDVPKKVSDTGLKITVQETNEDTGSIETHIMYIDVVHVGTISAAIC